MITGYRNFHFRLDTFLALRVAGFLLVLAFFRFTLGKRDFAF